MQIRFVYRPEDPAPFADAVERRIVAQHITRLPDAGRQREEPKGRCRAAHPPDPVHD